MIEGDKLYCGYVVKIKDLRKHENADRLQIANIFGHDVVVDLNISLGDIGVYFPSDGQLSEEFCKENKLLRKDGGYLDDNKRNIKAINLRKERSDGLFLPICCLEKFGDVSELVVGDTIDTFNGHVIAQKYIPNISANNKNKSKSKSKKSKIKMPYFVEHIDTPQLAYNPNMFKEGDVICLTEKVHGTSARHSNTKIENNKFSLLNLFKKKNRIIADYNYVTGTRRTIVRKPDGGYYGDNKFRLDWAKKFEGKLYKGEQVFCEIAGFCEKNKPIMGSADNKKTNSKAFIKRFGDKTTFSYGCNSEIGESRLFIYRMTYASPEGYVIEYPWDLVKLRAEQMGFETVPELARFIYTTKEDLDNVINEFLDMPSTIDNSHVIEGVVVRALNSTDFKVAKAKSFYFKVLEGIIKDTADAPDMEELEELNLEG